MTEVTTSVLTYRKSTIRNRIWTRHDTKHWSNLEQYQDYWTENVISQLGLLCSFTGDFSNWPYLKNNSYNSEFYIYIFGGGGGAVSIPWRHTSSFLEPWNQNWESDFNSVSDFAIIPHKISFFDMHIFNSSLPIAFTIMYASTETWKQATSYL